MDSEAFFMYIRQEMVMDCGSDGCSYVINSVACVHDTSKGYSFANGTVCSTTDFTTRVSTFK